MGMTDNSDDRREKAIGMHAEAINVLITPDYCLSILAVTPDGQPYFITPQHMRESLMSFIRQLSNGEAWIVE
jgi:hypothetical protein